MKHKTIKEQQMGKCVHFNGLFNKECEACVPYDKFRQLRPEKQDGKEWLPCLIEGEAVQCEQRRWRTEEEAELIEKEINESMQRTVNALIAIQAEAEKLKLGKGNGGTGEVKCPNCEDGTIHFSVAGYNGHRHARCTTDSCVAFME